MATKDFSNTNVPIIRKNKNYSSVQEAKVFYEKQRLHLLSFSWFPESEYPNGFKEKLIELMFFQNPVSMNVWHNKSVIIKEEDGTVVCPTWHNMCSFERRFNCAEMFQCVEVLKRVTPNELINQADRSFTKWMNEQKPDSSYEKLTLKYFNDVKYPEIESMIANLQLVLFEIEEQLCKPIRDKINSDLKIMYQLPVGKDVIFIKPRERKM